MEHVVSVTTVQSRFATRVLCFNWFMIGLLVAGSVMMAVKYDLTVSIAQASNPEQAIHVELAQPDPAFEREVACLAKNAYFEARGEGLAGQLSTMWVVKNRVDRSDFPDTWCDVIYAGIRDDAGEVRMNQCAFSWTCDGIPDRVADKQAYERIEQIARDFINGDRRGLDLTEGSTHFHAAHVNPNWSRVYHRVTKIENHVYYRRSEWRSEEAVSSSDPV